LHSVTVGYRGLPTLAFGYRRLPWVTHGYRGLPTLAFDAKQLCKANVQSKCAKQMLNTKNKKKSKDKN